MSEHRNVVLPNGNVLELEIKDGFYDKVRQHFGLPTDSYVDDDHLRMFVYGSLKTAIDRVENEQRNASKEVH